MTSQPVSIDRNNVPPHLARLANTSRSLNVYDEQPAPPSFNTVLQEQQQFNVRDAEETARCSNVSLDDVRNLHRHQNALFRPHARVGNERLVAAENPIGRLIPLQDPNLPTSEILCAMDKQERMRAQVDRRIVEAKAAGFKGNELLERARALRTGTLVPRKTNNNGSVLLVGNNNPGTNGGSSSTASYEIGYNESNNFLRRMTGVEFEGEKCQRMARKERAIIAPQPMPEPPAGYLPGGGHFLNERERLDILYDNPHLSGNFVKPMKPINPHQWTDRPVSYRPPIRYNLADEIPFEAPNNAGVFMQPEPIGSRISSDESVPVRGMPGDNFAAIESLQIRAPRDETYLDKYKKSIGPLEPPLPFSASYDEFPVSRDEKIASYTVVKPKVEKEHLAQTSVDSISRGIQLVDESALFDPSTFRPLGVKTGDLEKDQRARAAAGKSAEAAAQQFQAARLIGDNETFTAGTMSVDLAGKKAAVQGAQREATAAQEYAQRTDLHSRIAIGGDPEMFTNSAQVAALERTMLQAPQDGNQYLRQRMREVQSMAGAVGDTTVALDDAQFVDVGHATVSQTGSLEQTQRVAAKEKLGFLRAQTAAQRANAYDDGSIFEDTTFSRQAVEAQKTSSLEQEKRFTAKEKLALLQAKMAARRANAFDDDLLFEDTAFSRQAANKLSAPSVSMQRGVLKDQQQCQRNFERVRDALQRVRLTVTDDTNDPSHDFSGVGDRVADRMGIQTAAALRAEKTRQLEQRMMTNANDSRVQLDETRFIDTTNKLNSASTTVHRDEGPEGARLRGKEIASLANSKQNMNRATMLTDEMQFNDAADRAVHVIRPIDMKESTTAQRVKINENATIDQARFQFARKSAFEDVVDPQSIYLVQQQMATSLQDNRKTVQKEQDMQSRMTSILDNNSIGDNAATRIGADNMQTVDKVQQIKGDLRGAASMQSAAMKMQAQQPTSDIDLQNYRMATQQDIRATDTNRQALIDKRIMAENNSRLTGIDDNFGASMYQESLINGGNGGETAQRARIKGEERERGMYAEERAKRQVLRPTDTEMFQHFTVDSSVGTEPYGGKAAFDRRADRREMFVQDTPRVTYDAMEDSLTVDHVLQRLEATRCDKPSTVLYAQRQEAHEKELARLERAPPAHLLPAYMSPGGKKVVTPRGSPAPSPIPR